jgi:hypothetical protein
MNPPPAPRLVMCRMSPRRCQRRLKLKREKLDSVSMGLSYHTLAWILKKDPVRLEEALEWANKSLMARVKHG